VNNLVTANIFLTVVEYLTLPTTSNNPNELYVGINLFEDSPDILIDP
jgi:hypothetical protein